MAVGVQMLGFSLDGKLFALINDQGILQIWDTATNELRQEFIPNFHLVGPCSALVWIGVPREKSVKEFQPVLNITDSPYIALGTSKGQVTLYSYALGKIERVLKGGHSGRITSICSDNLGKLFTCGEDRQIIVWELAEEKCVTVWSVGNETPRSIAHMAHSNSLVVGVRQLRVYSVETQEVVQTFTGHMSEVNLMTYFSVGESAEYVVTTSKMERIISLWKIGRKGRNEPAICTLLMEDVAHCLTCKVNNEGNVEVASVTRNGVIHIYMLSTESIEAGKPIKPKGTIDIASDSSTVIKPIFALAVYLRHRQDSRKILIAYGGKHILTFENLELKLHQKTMVLVRADPTKPHETMFGKHQNTANSLKSLAPVIGSQDHEYKSSLSRSKKKLKSTELPMESRLKNLNLNSSDGKSKPRSKIHLLVQSLHSKDEILLRSVFNTNDLQTIQLTLQKLPVQYVGTFVNGLTHLMQQKRINVELSMTWLKLLTQTHSSQLLAHGADELLNKFGPCIGIIEHRAKCLKELSKLNGRLQLLVSQIKRNTEEENLNCESALVLEDNDSSNSEVEDTVDKSLSDGEWEEDDDDDEVIENLNEGMQP